jgi:hypothetical protein
MLFLLLRATEGLITTFLLKVEIIASSIEMKGLIYSIPLA